MESREQELRRLAAEVTDNESVVDAWTAKSFTDRLFVLDVESGCDLPENVRQTLLDHDLRGYNEVHDVSVDDSAFAGELDSGDRYRFVDVRERGQLQSYVVD